MNKISLSENLKLKSMLKKHKNKYKKEYMIGRFDKHSKLIWDDIDKFPIGERLQKKRRYELFIKYLRVKVDDIIAGNPEKLQLIIDHVETNFKSLPFRSSDHIGSSKEQTNLYKQLITIFNYKDFCKADNWGAYELTKALDTAVCPYCDQQYIHTHYDKALKMRATLDHYYDKGTYPFLSISFYNLIPSCYFCNSIIKYKKAFTIKTHLHPYLHGFEDHLRFRVKFRRNREEKEEIDYTKILEADPKTFTIGFESNPSSNKEICKLARRNIHDLKIREVYRVHKDYVSEIIYKSVVYNDAFVASLFNAHPKLFTNEEEITRIVLGNYINLDDQGKRVLSKLARDIARQFKLTDRLTFPYSKSLIRRRSLRSK